LIGLTKSSALNYAPNIRVNAIAPAVVDTNMLKSIPAERLDQYRYNEKISKPLLPDNIADTVLFLLGSGGSHYTGTVFDLNNGVYFR